MPKTFACPRCGKLSTWQDNPYRPFCSERCKLIDLGAWANDDYKLPTEDAPQAENSEE
ncbi:DNA gyrase inhibitor YacG [Acinetobacter sp. ANC 4910]|uniref:DNA gyrase inhibitor YacG n=1 Tax=Acinetobacter sp. ANC 4910 TaxID=2529850 RepID=UPI00103F7FBF|nr:DNA gyrase inhibitor YacG [Acinetobacter sp. ANC 4910]TCB35806.1 DNA gyrase inhibitor YacG [Acinetobacter sp. ANC 4910]